jgi:hypothetical protein
MSLGSSVFRDIQEDPRFMQDGALSYLCFMLVRGFVTISFLGGLGVDDHQSGLGQVQILLNVVYSCGVGGGGDSMKETRIIA